MAELDNLSDLFESDEQRRARRDRGPTTAFDQRWWLRRVFFALILGSLIWGVLWVARVGVFYPLAPAIVLVLLVLREAVGRMRGRALPPELTAADRELSSVDRRLGLRSGTPLRDGVEIAVGRWEDRLSWGERDGKRLATVVVPRIAELTDERLRQKYGLTRASDPARARQLLGEELWQLLTAPPKRGLGLRDVTSIVAKLEAL